MTAYTTNGSMKDLLYAMRDKLYATSQIGYLRDVRIRVGPHYWPPFDKFTVYLEPNGSPEENIGQRDALWIKRATHIVRVTCLVPWADPDYEESILGREKSHAGLVDMVDDVISYLENNTLGLTGLEPALPPTIEADEGAFFGAEAEDNMYVRVAELRYEARTKAIVRPVDS